MKYLLALVLIFCLAGCGKSIINIDTVTITLIGTCADYDPISKTPIGITNEFPSGTRRIVLYLNAHRTTAINVTYSWQFGDAKLAEFVAPLDEGMNFAEIGTQELSKSLPNGSYKVQVKMGDLLLKEMTFTIKDVR